MRSSKLFWVVSLVLAIAGFTGGSLISHETSTEAGKAVWKEVYASPAEMAARVDAIVLARVTGTRQGRVVWSENGEDALPFQIVELEVLQGIKGAAKAERISLERVGGTAPDGRALDLSYDGGAFEPGATYLLFLKRQEDGPHFYQVNHQGRYLVAGDRLWAADPEDSVAKAFEGAPVARVVGELRRSSTREWSEAANGARR
ncbi:MAG TPA: hypothetical protein VF789_29390 [Thermoanaerobaculia bacterium]